MGNIGKLEDIIGYFKKQIDDIKSEVSRLSITNKMRGIVSEHYRKIAISKSEIIIKEIA